MFMYICSCMCVVIDYGNTNMSVNTYVRNISTKPFGTVCGMQLDDASH